MEPITFRQHVRCLRRKKRCFFGFLAVFIFLCVILIKGKGKSLYKFLLMRRGMQYKFRYFNVPEIDPEMAEMVKNQKCKIPIINPFNPEILPHLTAPTMENCRAKKYGVVSDGILRVKVENVLTVTLYYIYRVDDFKNEWSDSIVIHNGWEREIDILHPVKDEFFKLEIQFGDELHEEYHAAVLKSPESVNDETDPKKQLNIVILLFDSVSDAHAQRSLPKTYKYIREHTRTVIMKGHSIVGDGTTSQLCAMLTGTAEGDLPEARKSWNNSNSVDNWPWIFKDMHKENYKTLYAEEYQYAGTFQYRLKGFDKSPTTHYLRPLWLAMQKHIDDHGLSCAHQFHFDYLQQFLDAYKDHNKFAIVFNAITHNSLDTLENADVDIVNFYESFERSQHVNNTLVIFMGDHGLRTSAFRGTLHGKLEERLPLMAFTLPPYFDSYPEQVDNLKRNSHLMTSHFDTYATFQHLITFPKLNKNVQNKYGKSLFTDIRKYNRTCDQAGVAKHWCTCLNYEPVDPTKDPNVIKVVNLVIKYMNDLLKDVKDSCNRLTLLNVTRSGRRVPNTAVNQFLQTETAETGCDSCQVKYSKQKSFSRYEYEINFSVSPSRGTFEAVGEVVYDEDGDIHISHSTDISRTNRYNDQPKCIAKKFPHLRKFCYCTH